MNECKDPDCPHRRHDPDHFLAGLLLMAGSLILHALTREQPRRRRRKKKKKGKR